MATTNTTHVNFVKVPTTANFEDITTKVDGTIYFIVDAKKIYLDGVMYGFNDTDVADRFLELTGGEMSGDIDMDASNAIKRSSHISFYIDTNKITSQSQDGGMVFHAGADGQILLTLKDDNSINFSSEDIRGIPEPAHSTSPISKGYLDTNVINKKGVANGFASLNASGIIPSTQLPSYVDDILDYNNRTSFPNTGESDKIYLALDTGDLWRWSGSKFVRISDGSGLLVLGETSSTAFRGDYGADAYLHTQIISNNPHQVTKEDVGLRDVENYEVASPAEAKAGISSVKYMTPLRTAQAIEELAPRLTWTVIS